MCVCARVVVLLAGNSDDLEDPFGELHGPADPELAETQWQFIENAIATSTADYLWVGGHYPGQYQQSRRALSFFGGGINS